MPESRSRRSIRLRGYDYALAGAYFVTIVTRDRQCLFGEIVDGQTRLNLWGKIAQDEWQKSAQIRKEIVMPNHIHALLSLPTRRGGRPAGRPYNPDQPSDPWVRSWAGSNLPLPNASVNCAVYHARRFGNAIITNTSSAMKDRFIASANILATIRRDGSSIKKIP